MTTNLSQRLTLPGFQIKFPPYTFFVLGGVLATLFFSYTLLSIYYTPPSSDYISTHAGIFNSDLSQVTLLFLLMIGIYIVCYIFFRSTNVQPIQMRKVVLFSLLFAIILLLSPPFLSSDLYGYVFRAEIANVHDVNPYKVTPAELGYSGIVTYAEGVTPYGPVYTVYSMLLQKISGSELAAKLTIFRLFNLILFFACAWLLYRIAKIIIPSYANSSVTLFLWNPFILIELINNGHNDVLILLSILLSIFLLLQNKYITAGAVLVLGFLVKFVTIFLIPLSFLWILHSKQGVKKKAYLLVGLIFAIVAIIAVMYIPFDNFSENIGNLGVIYLLSYKLTFPFAIIKSVIILLGNYLVGFSFTAGLLLNISLGIFVVLYLVTLFYSRRAFKRLLIYRYFWIILLVLTFIPLINNIWYTIWFMPLVLLISDKRYHILIIFFTISGFAFYVSNFFLANSLFFILLISYYLLLKIRPIAEKYWSSLTLFKI